MFKVTNIKNKLLENKTINIVQGFNLDFIAKRLSKENVCLIYDDKICDKEFISNCFKIRQLCSLYNSLFFIKNRCDIAKIVDADGIFLDKYSLTLNYAKEIMSDEKIFGFILSNDSECVLSEINNFDIMAIDFDKKEALNNILARENISIPYCIYKNDEQIRLR